MTDEKINSPGFIWPAILVVLGVIPALGAMANPRSFNGIEYLRDVRELQFGHAHAIGQAFTGATIVVGIMCFAFAATRSHLDRRGGILWGGSLLLSTGPALSSVFGSSPHISVSHLVLPLLTTGVFLLPSASPEWLARGVKRVALCYFYGSILAAVVAPHWALEIPYNQGYISWLPVRFHGLGVHASQLALWCLLYLILNLWLPSKGLFGRLNLLVCLTVLFFTQYKTAWLAAVLCVILHFIFAPSRRGRLRFAKALVLGGIGSAVWFGVSQVAPQLLATRQGQFTTLTGRTNIWQVSLDVWSQSKIFGFGPHLWDFDMSLRYLSVLGWTPSQAHSQYIQTLAEAGIIGLVGLIAYLAILLGTAARTWRRCSASLLLVLVLILRGVTDSWYRATVTDGNFFFHLMCFSLLLCSLRNPGRIRNATVRMTQMSGGLLPAGEAGDTRVQTPSRDRDDALTL